MARIFKLLLIPHTTFALESLSDSSSWLLMSLLTAGPRILLEALVRGLLGLEIASRKRRPPLPS